MLPISCLDHLIKLSARCSTLISKLTFAIIAKPVHIFIMQDQNIFSHVNIMCLVVDIYLESTFDPECVFAPSIGGAMLRVPHPWRVAS